MCVHTWLIHVVIQQKLTLQSKYTPAGEDCLSQSTKEARPRTIWGRTKNTPESSLQAWPELEQQPRGYCWSQAGEKLGENPFWEPGGLGLVLVPSQAGCASQNFI